MVRLRPHILGGGVLCIIALRVILETAVLADHFTVFRFLHHMSWFLSVMLLGVAYARYVIGMPRSALHRVAYSAPIFLLPVVHGMVSDGPMRLQYLRDMSYMAYAGHLLTANIYHPTNYLQSSALLVMIAMVFRAAYRYHPAGRAWWVRYGRAAVITAVGYVLLYSLLGIQWFGCAPNTRAVVGIPTELSNHVLLFVTYYSIAVCACLLSCLPELHKMVWRRDISIHTLLHGWGGVFFVTFGALAVCGAGWWLL